MEDSQVSVKVCFLVGKDKLLSLGTSSFPCRAVDAASLIEVVADKCRLVLGGVTADQMVVVSTQPPPRQLEPSEHFGERANDGKPLLVVAKPLYKVEDAWPEHQLILEAAPCKIIIGTTESPGDESTPSQGDKPSGDAGRRWWSSITLHAFGCMNPSVDDNDQETVRLNGPRFLAGFYCCVTLCLSGCRHQTPQTNYWCDTK